MSSWPEFLSQVASTDRLTLIGPRFEEHAHTPVMPSIYVDGGANFRARSTEFPTISVGDGDSSRVPMDHLLPAQKDFSDLAFVLRALPLTLRHLCLEGFLGGRRDHEIANFGEVHGFLSARSGQGLSRVDFSVAGNIGGAERVVAFAEGSVTLKINGAFSVFVFQPTTVGISGECRYPFDGKLAILSSRGLSNEGHGSVRLVSSAPCFVLLPS